jgi:tRNA pseudouridine13 synthase
VNEVDLDGNVVTLTTLEAPQPEAAPEVEAGEGAPAAAPADTAALVAAYGALSGAQGAESLAGLTAFLERAAALKADGSANAPAPLTLGALEAKEQRRAAHQLFKGLDWLPPLHTETVEAPGGGALQCLKLSVIPEGRAGAAARGQKRKRQAQDEWPPGARYVSFALYKENMETQHALGTLARALHCGPKVFAVAGTKDKRGVTVQRVTAFRVAPSRLAGLNARLRGMRVGNFAFAEQQLGLGDLSGNRFDIVLRGVSAASAGAAGAAAEALRASGFVNYFGLQRFGNAGVPTHRVGVALMRGEWAEAVRHIVAPGPLAWPDVAAAAAAYLDRGDAQAALAGMPPHAVAERAVLGVLARDGAAALVNALMAVPRNLRTIYLHAYQSYLWNAAASARVAAHGAAAAVAGDLVLPRAAMAAARRGRAAAGRPGGGADPDPEQAQAEAEAEVHVVTEEEAAAGAYGIEDVVLPLPGHAVRYPAHAAADVYRDVAAADGVELERAVHGVAEFSLARLPGAYRHLVHRPADLQYQVLRYDDPNAELASTELEALQGRPPPPVAAEGEARMRAAVYACGCVHSRWRGVGDAADKKNVWSSCRQVSGAAAQLHAAVLLLRHDAGPGADQDAHAHSLRQGAAAPRVTAELHAVKRSVKRARAQVQGARRRRRAVGCVIAGLRALTDDKASLLMQYLLHEAWRAIGPR